MKNLLKDAQLLPTNIHQSIDPVYGYDYSYGYTMALLKVLETFDIIQPDLKEHKRKQNYKTYRAIVDFILKNREALNEDPGAIIRCSDDADGGFELRASGRKEGLGWTG